MLPGVFGGRTLAIWSDGFLHPCSIPEICSRHTGIPLTIVEVSSVAAGLFIERGLGRFPCVLRSPITVTVPTVGCRGRRAILGSGPVAEELRFKQGMF